MLSNLLVTFPTKDTALIAYLREHDNELNKASDFFRIYSEYLSTDDVYTSSSWGICQEMLGNITDPYTLSYIQCRSGSWSASIDIYNNYQVVTFRDVVEWLIRNFLRCFL